MGPGKQLLDAIKPLLSGIKKPSSRSIDGPAYGKKVYRGKEQYWVGYRWSRPYSHFMTGNVYDAPLAYGDSYDDALERLRQKSAKAAA